VDEEVIDMRPTNDDDLLIFRLRVRAHMLEKMLSALYGAVLGSIPGDHESAGPIRLVLASSLEWLAQSAERDLMSAPDLKGLSDSERSLFADEFRDVVSELKTFVENLASGSREKT